MKLATVETNEDTTEITTPIIIINMPPAKRINELPILIPRFLR